MASNIALLRREALAARVTGWAGGPDLDRIAAERRDYAAKARIDAEYLHDALAYNEDRTICMVERLAQMANSPMHSDADFREGFRTLLGDLIEASAASHAAQCDLNGWPA